MTPLTAIDTWPAPAAAALVLPNGTVHQHGDTTRLFALASVTKLFTALAALVAHEEGTLDLDEPLEPTGVTVADLLAHAAGVSDPPRPDRPPFERRLYSSAAYDRVAALVASRSGIDFPTYLHEAVVAPLGLTMPRLEGSAGADAMASVDDVVAVLGAWQRPHLVSSVTLERARRAHRPDLAGIVPGFGRFDPCPWGLGPELRGDKHPHWTGSTNSTGAYGHFGQSGTMAWVDPVREVSLVALCDEPFGTWATAAWPQLSDAVLDWAG